MNVRRDRLQLVAIALTSIVALFVAFTGIKLTTTYRPAGLDFGTSSMEPDQRRSVELVRWHEGGLVALVGVTVVVAGVAMTSAVAGRRRADGRRRSVARALASIAAAVSSAAALFTWQVTGWDQLGMWAMLPEPEGRSSGLWLAAFDDQVRFVLVGGVELSQATYAAWMLLHLALPFTALAAAAAAAVLSIGPERRHQNRIERLVHATEDRDRLIAERLTAMATEAGLALAVPAKVGQVRARKGTGAR